MTERHDWWLQAFAAADRMRQVQGALLGCLGLGPDECSYRIAASAAHWRLRAYAGGADGPSVLIVSAPIKRPYIWDLSPDASVIRYGLAHRLRIYLLEWLPPHAEAAGLGLERYVRAIGEGVGLVASDGGARPFLMGHSLGGTLAAIFAALEPASLRGLVLLSSPLCFRPGASRFRDALVGLLPPGLSGHVAVPGSLVSQVSAWASPDTFIWSRLADAMFSAGDPAAARLHARVEMWSLDEVPLSGRLVDEVGRWLYREDRFCRETLVVAGRTIGPSRLTLPTLAVFNTADAIASPESVTHFLDAVPAGYARSIAYAGEAGVSLQHVALLVGRKARATVWPAILSWLASTA